MSVIQTIRNKYAKVMFFVLILALLGFILMYATNDIGSFFRQSTDVGAINGDKIGYQEYEALVQQREAQIKQQNPNASLNESQSAQLRDQVWEQMIKDRLMADINEKMGLTVTKAEIMDMITGPEPDQQVRQAFTNPNTGQFDPQEAIATVQRLERSKDPNEKMAWENFKSELAKQRLENKFNAMVNGAVYTPKALLDAANKDRYVYASVQYVQLPYSLISDNEVKVSDEEIQKYMEAHRPMFEQKKPSRSIEYVSFDVTPSSLDSQKVITTLDTMKNAFAAATDVDVFINRNSENPMPAQYQTAQTLQGYPNAAELMTAPSGTVVGPFYYAPTNAFMLARIEEKRSFPDSVKCRHILVSFKQGAQEVRTDAEAKARIDSAIAQVRAGVPFDSVVKTYSDDPGSVDKGGQYDFALTQKAMLTQPFGDFIFEGKTGENKVVRVESDGYSGYHYIEILHQGAPAATTKIAMVSKQLTTDPNTYDEVFTRASQFANKVAANPKSFDKEVQAAGLMKQPASGLDANSALVGSLGAARDLVKWTYNAKIDDVSPIMTLGDRYVVAKLTGIQKPGLPAITDDNRAPLTNIVMRGKKAAMLAERNKGKTLEAIAQTENQQMATDDSLTFFGSRTAVSQEARVLGYAFYPSFKENTVSPGISGRSSVYFIQVGKRYEMPAPADRNLQMEQMMSGMMVKNNAAGIVIQGMREKADVKDTRGQLY